MIPILALLFLTLPVSVPTTDPILPDPKLTPGAVEPSVTVEDLRHPEFIRASRNVPDSLKEQVFIEYFGRVPEFRGDYEIDHLISLELGGSNDLSNLWPQSYKTQPWNARKKDVLENKLHRMILSGEIGLREAQNEIAENWIKAYKKYVGGDS